MKMPATFAAQLFVVALIGGCSPAPEAEPSDRASEAVPAPIVPPTVAPTSPPRVPPPVPLQFRALGTEPFWSAAVDGTKLTYSTPESTDNVTITVIRKLADKGAIYTGAIDGKPLELVVTRETCSDGMSDAVYPFTVIRRIGPDNQRGCAR